MNSLKINKINYFYEAYDDEMFSYFNATKYLVVCTFYVDGCVVSWRPSRFSNYTGSQKVRYRTKCLHIIVSLYLLRRWPHGPCATFIFQFSPSKGSIWSFPFRIDRLPVQFACSFKYRRLLRWLTTLLHIEKVLVHFYFLQKPDV